MITIKYSGKSEVTKREQTVAEKEKASMEREQTLAEKERVLEAQVMERKRALAEKERALEAEQKACQDLLQEQTTRLREEKNRIVAAQREKLSYVSTSAYHVFFDSAGPVAGGGSTSSDSSLMIPTTQDRNFVL